MTDPYLYPGTTVLKNLASIMHENKLSYMEAEYTSIRLAELVSDDFKGPFDFKALCHVHYTIFQDIYEWAGKPRIINIEKEEAVLGGLSIEYSDYKNIKSDAVKTLNDMNNYPWESMSRETVIKEFSAFMAKLWRVHPFREGNTRTIVTFSTQFIESRGWYIDSELFKDNAQYMRNALIASSAIFHDLGDLRKTEYLERILEDALIRGQEMKRRVAEEIMKAGFRITEQNISNIVNWNRKKHFEHSSEEIRTFLTK